MDLLNFEDRNAQICIKIDNLQNYLLCYIISR